MFTKEIPEYSSCRRWKKANIVGALKNWDPVLKTGLIQMYNLKRKCYTRFSIKLEYNEIDNSDVQFLRYFVNKKRTYYKGSTIMIAFDSPNISIKETDVDSVVIFQINTIFIMCVNNPLANNSNITFKYDVKKDTISTILKEFSVEFLEDNTIESRNFCKILGKTMSKVFNKWILSKSDDEIETIII